ncbi:hypothetical protein K505DRAFT_358059 [Melanomma pulvis-pyrius CBS 109.77]|uniref:Uncharacterized protein n=1 Tax=Melanomma pulvis-pyrius CBS 109.77 TaxID=1314802 RepID=A0A6A6XQP1_9PLEO|nr:hypothetical protein K505DRAFT_358059 [Melanomma pulvis-pyrius CBS 109.77]
MAKKTKPYNLKQTMAILDALQPGLLRRLPPGESFTFAQDQDGKDRLHVGHVCGGSVHVWISLAGKSKVRMLYESGLVFKTYYNPGLEDFAKVTLIEPFNHLKETGGGGNFAWDDMMKAMAPFLFLRAGLVRKFVDLNAGRGIEMLVAALRAIPVAETGCKGPADMSSEGTSSEGTSCEETSLVDTSLVDMRSIDKASPDQSSADPERLQNDQLVTLEPAQSTAEAKDEPLLLDSTTKKKKRAHGDFLEGEANDGNAPIKDSKGLNSDSHFSTTNPYTSSHEYDTELG